MKWLAAILIVTVAEWSAVPAVEISWQVALGAKYLTVAILIQALWSVSSNESLLFRTVVAFFCVAFWVDLLAYLVWISSGSTINASLAIFIIFSLCMIYLLLREYDIKSDKINPANMTILLLRPRTEVEFIKSFFGAPVASVCLIADGNVWAYRKCSGVFEKNKYSAAVLKNHIAVDTGVKCTEAILGELENIVGTNRLPCCKCVYSIRAVLNMLGDRFSVKTFDLIPGVYALKILGRKR